MSGKLAILLLCLALPGESFAAPSTPVISTPASGVGATYNTRPWIYFSAASTYNINRARIQIASDSGFSTILYDRDSPSYTAEFYPLPTTGGTTIRHRVDTALTTGTRYIRVMVWDIYASASSWSATTTITISAASWTDSTLTAGTTLVRAVHFTELRTAINNVRLFRGLSAYSWTDTTLTAGTTLVRAVHLTEMQNALSSAYNTAVGSTPTFTDTTITAGSTLIRKIHIDELRAAVLYP